LGKYEKQVPGLGTFFNFLKTTPGYFVCIFTPFMLIIIYEGVRFFNLFRRYRREQMEEMQAEKNRLDAERAENQRMMQELLALKAQLEKQQGSVAPPEETSEDNSEK
jgi:hypothetical protein